MKQSRFTDDQIIGLLKKADAGMSAKELCRTGGFSQPTLYKWRSALAAKSLRIENKFTHTNLYKSHSFYHIIRP
jgi:hypothetical protein